MIHMEQKLIIIIMSFLYRIYSTSSQTTYYWTAALESLSSIEGFCLETISVLYKHCLDHLFELINILKQCRILACGKHRKTQCVIQNKLKMYFLHLRALITLIPVS